MTAVYLCTLHFDNYDSAVIGIGTEKLEGEFICQGDAYEGYPESSQLEFWDDSPSDQGSLLWKANHDASGRWYTIQRVEVNTRGRY